MNFNEAVKHTNQNLLGHYKEVVYKGYELVTMTRNSTTSYYINEKIDIKKIYLKHITDRFKQISIDEEIKAIKLIFDVKARGKRKYRIYEEYFKIIN